MVSRGDGKFAREALRFRSRDLWELTDRLEAVWEARTIGELMASSLELIVPFFDADATSVGFTDPRRRRHVAIGTSRGEWAAGVAKIAEAYRRFAPQSAMLQYWMRTGDHERVLRRTDCCDLTAYRETALYRECDLPMGCVLNLGTWLRPGGGRHIEIGMSREGQTDFSERDVARLAFLRRYVFRAYVGVCGRATVEGDGPLPEGTVELQDTTLADGADGPERGGEEVQLTAREREVLRWVIEGKTNKEIGIILGVSWRTVRVHCERIFRKLGVETRTAAAMEAMERGLRV